MSTKLFDEQTIGNSPAQAKVSSKSTGPMVDHLPQTQVQVEDDRTGITVDTLKRALIDNLYYIQGKAQCFATPHDYYMALAHTVRDRMLYRRIKTAQTYLETDPKTVYYLSAEFLIGRLLSNNLINLGLYEPMRQALAESGLDLDDLLEREADPGLGNGGLGRLAACFLDSLATLEIPALGYGIRYEFGIFDQSIQEGWQVERRDEWLRYGNPWEISRPEYRVEVHFGGHTTAYKDHQGNYRVQWIPKRTVLGTPYDTPVPGYNNNTVNKLRLWGARSGEEFNFQVFNTGDYTRAVADKVLSENISKVLYPNDDTLQGQELRLEQQYFFVSCSLQDIIRLYLRKHDTFEAFPQKVAIQLNDTHPSIGIAELMHLLVDQHEVNWDQAWSITRQTFGYTNHTLLAEALERWPVELFGRLLPRHLEIIYEINYRFLRLIRGKYPGDEARVARMSIIGETPQRHVRMAHLACVGSHAVNGVAQLHTELIKQDVMPDFYQLWPERFSNKTNGVTPRRWMLISNPQFASLITEKIGLNWLTRLEDLQQLEAFADDPEFCDRASTIKQSNKQVLADYIQQTNEIIVDPNSLFDVQIKRMHEYKRQLLNVLYVITLYNRIKQDPGTDILPRTFIFSGKAAPGYYMAKLIIKLINSVAEVVNHDPDVAGRLKVVFLANCSVSLAQRVYPAANLSEQISMAGKEASGTGNMKFAMNGALTIGTLDGANVEIREAVGADNFFLFGLTTPEVVALKAKGYKPWDYYNTNTELRAVIDRIAAGCFSHGLPGLFAPIVESLLQSDQYLHCADYQAYINCQEAVTAAYQDPHNWTRMSILNTARMGKFSSDRTVREYCQEIWQVEPVKISLEADPPEAAAQQTEALSV